jgi:hypothetical protein
VYAAGRASFDSMSRARSSLMVVAECMRIEVWWPVYGVRLGLLSREAYHSLEEMTMLSTRRCRSLTRNCDGRYVAGLATDHRKFLRC